MSHPSFPIRVGGTPRSSPPHDSNLLAFGAILHYPDLADLHPENIEGGRAAAAFAASHFGKVLKISEDGLTSFFQNGIHVWDM
ncbi:MAG: hypothetical protein DMG13_28540 [Acidobacteria bacterium]|nr:MAG: hypothetical protein DMG13_28540 [Acidobacteriota bacterium]